MDTQCGKTKLEMEPFADLASGFFFTPTSKLVVGATFGLCTLVLATRDVLFSVLFSRGLSLGFVLFFTGLGCVLANHLYCWMQVESRVKPDKVGLETLRFFFGLLSTSAAVSCLNFLSASTVNIASRATLPLMILLSPFLGEHYNKKQKILASLLLLCVSWFFVESLLADEQAVSSSEKIGFVLLATATLLLIVEFKILAINSRSSNSYYLAATPGAALLLAGTCLSLWMPHDAGQTQGTFTDAVTACFCGALLFLAYYSGKIRYRVLPAGLAEFPSVATFLLILPVDILLFDRRFSNLWLVNSFIVFAMMLILMRVKDKNKTTV